MVRLVFFVWGVLCAHVALAQEGEPVRVKVTDTYQRPLLRASVELLRADSSLIKISFTDSTGKAEFKNTGLPVYLLRVSMVDHLLFVALLKNDGKLHTVLLQPAEKTLRGVKIIAQKPFFEIKPDRTVVNVEASITNAGSTVLEVLEKLPGVTVDADGNISLKGKTNLMVMLDGKPTYLSGAELASLLSGMTAAQVAQIELIDNPPASFDAAGNGVINIKTKKGFQRGFNGTITTTGQQGVYARTADNLLLNFRSGGVNLFLNYGLNTIENFSRAYALRSYYKSDGTLNAMLEQANYLARSNTVHNLRTGMDFSFSPSTSASISLTGIWQDQVWKGDNPALWMKNNRSVDSVLITTSYRGQNWRNNRATANFSHRFNSRQDLSADVDLIGYRSHENQLFETKAASYTEHYRGYLPSDLNIFSAKVDFTQRTSAVSWQAGAKTSKTNTDNIANYFYSDGGPWRIDTGKTNHFIYKENIYALYANVQEKRNRWWWQGGLRFELTDYNGRQLVKDSTFSRNFSGLFPSFSVSFEKDSFNTFSFSAGRRIERVPFQKLNPFIQIFNKYTYQKGNPYLHPQYIWNLQLNHSYKNSLLTGISYNLVTDYLMQVFPNAADGIVTYTEGNLGRLQNFGASVGLQKSIGAVWSFVLQTQLNHKRFNGVVLGSAMTANYTQYNVNLNNQFRFGKDWTGEVSGIYNSSSKNDIQEIVYPSGQLSVGLAKNFAENKGTIKFSVRDLFYTSWFEGFSWFSQATEYFKITRDSRFAALTLTWRFGKAYKTAKRPEGAAGEEVQRVGNE